MSVFPVVKGTRLRATKVNSCGLPIAGPANYLVTDGFVQVTLTPVMRDANDLEQTNAEGRVCVADRTPPERKWYTAEVELCNVNTGLITLFNGWPQILDFDDSPIGFRDQQEVESDFGVAIEIWTGGKSDDDCPAPTTDSIFASAASGKKYGYLLFFASEFTLGNIQVSDAVATFTLSGITFPGSQWGKGPWNVQAIDADATAGRLLEPLDGDSHFSLFRTPIAPPDVTPGAEARALAISTLFQAPDFYFGGPGNAPAADVAPDQAAVVASVDLTISGAPTAGTTTLDVTYPDGSDLETGTILFNATPANVLTALAALDDGYAAGDWTVSGSNLPTGPVKIIAPDGVVVDPGTNALTGGTTPTVHVDPSA